MFYLQFHWDHKLQLNTEICSHIEWYVIIEQIFEYCSWKITFTFMIAFDNYWYWRKIAIDLWFDIICCLCFTIIWLQLTIIWILIAIIEDNYITWIQLFVSLMWYIRIRIWLKLLCWRCVELGLWKLCEDLVGLG